MSITNNRVTLYFSPRKDKDLIAEISGVEAGDINWCIKSLMRDGIKYRQKGKVHTSTTQVVSSPVNEPPSWSASLIDIETKKREITDSELESSFDNL